MMMSNTYHPALRGVQDSEPHVVHCSSLITHHSQRGQVLIITLLVMAVSLTIGLAISSRTITTLRQISYSAQSAQALSFAEAGIEHTLNCLKDETCGAGDSGSLDVNADGTNDCDYTIEALPERPVFTELSPIARDRVIQLDLENYPAGTELSVYWVDRGKTDETTHPAAMEVSIVYLDPTSGEYEVSRCAWDRITRIPPNNFFLPFEGVFDIGTGITYKYQTDNSLCSLAAPAGTFPKLLRLRALYNIDPDTGEEVPNSFAVKAPTGINLPPQGVQVESTGFVGRVRRKVRVTRSKTAALSEIFDYVLFSGSADPADALTK